MDREKILAEIHHHISPVIGWLRMDAKKGRVDEDQERLHAWEERAEKAADAIVELLGEPEYFYTTDQPYDWGSGLVRHTRDLTGYDRVRSLEQAKECAEALRAGKPGHEGYVKTTYGVSYEREVK